MKRIRVIWCLLIFLAVFSLWVHWGNTSIQITPISISSERVPASLDGFKIVHVADLHNAEFGHKQSKLISVVKEADPDLIAITGDLIDSSHADVEKAMDFINQAIKIAPVYFVTGNHEAWSGEYARLERMMIAAGVIILRDEEKIVEYGGECIRMVGLDDPSFTLENDLYGESAAIIETRLKAVLSENSTYAVLLSHRPELFEVYVANYVDLVLSGHAHGGQVRLPFIGGIIAPNQGLFPEFSEGVHEKNQTKMVVSRGLGNSILPVRINNRPELLVITLSTSRN